MNSLALDSWQSTLQNEANRAETLQLNPVALLRVAHAAKGTLGGGEPGSLVGMLAARAAEELVTWGHPRGFRRDAPPRSGAPPGRH